MRNYLCHLVISCAQIPVLILYCCMQELLRNQSLMSPSPMRRMPPPVSPKASRQVGTGHKDVALSAAACTTTTMPRTSPTNTRSGSPTKTGLGPSRSAPGIEFVRSVPNTIKQDTRRGGILPVVQPTKLEPANAGQSFRQAHAFLVMRFRRR